MKCPLNPLSDVGPSNMDRVAALGGGDGPFEMIFEFVGGRAPSGHTWGLMRTWRAISRTFSLAWMQYNRDVETVGLNAGQQ